MNQPMTMRASLAVVGAPIVFFLGVCALAWATASPGPPRVGVFSSAAIDPAYPQETLRDLVSYSDQVSVVRVVRDERPPARDADETGGMDFRPVTMHVDETIWRGASHAAVPDTLEFFTWGWLKGRPIGAEGGARLEVGRRYLMAITHGKEAGATKWWSFSDSAQLRMKGGRTDADDVVGEPSALFSRLADLTLDEVAVLLARTRPDPLAVKYADLGAVERWEAVARARG